MKTVLLTLSFLLFAFITKPSLATTDDAVLDQDGDPLVPTRRYYVLPIFHPNGGGLSLAKIGNETRPVSVVQERFFSNNGKELLITPASGDDYIPLGRPVEIEFAEKPTGVSSGKWLLVNDLGETWSVGIGYSIDHPGFSTLEGYFWIKKAALHAYSLSFLPYVRSYGLGVDIGRMDDDDGYIRLVARQGEAYTFMFVKASSEVAKM